MRQTTAKRAAKQRPIDRREICEVLTRHPGARAELARRSKVKPQTVYNWIKHGKTSANIADNARKLALELLDIERKLRAA